MNWASSLKNCASTIPKSSSETFRARFTWRRDTGVSQWRRRNGPPKESSSEILFAAREKSYRPTNKLPGSGVFIASATNCSGERLNCQQNVHAASLFVRCRISCRRQTRVQPELFRVLSLLVRRLAQSKLFVPRSTVRALLTLLQS